MNFHEDMREKRFLHFRSKWPKTSNLLPVTGKQGHISNEYEVLSLFDFEKIEDTRQTDRRTDDVPRWGGDFSCIQTVNAKNGLTR